MYRFALIVPCAENEDRFEEVVDRLGKIGSTDVEVVGHYLGIAIEFERVAANLEAAIEAAIEETGKAGITITKIEIDHSELAAG